MQQIFESIYSSLHASSGLALTAAFVWGVFSLLSPCNLVTIPLWWGHIESTRTEKSAGAQSPWPFPVEYSLILPLLAWCLPPQEF